MSFWSTCAATYSLMFDALEDEASVAKLVQLCFELAFDALEDESLPALPLQLGFGAGFGLRVEALEDEPWPAISFHALGVVVITGGPRTLEGMSAERLPDQGELLEVALPKL